MTIDDYKRKFTEEDAVGWQCIDQTLEELYGNKKPRHYAPELHYIAGGEDPIDGASIYDSEEQEKHYHIISYGMSTLYYDEEAVGDEHSKYGFEFTIRLKPFSGDGGDPLWAIQVMNNLARYVLKTGKWFEEFHFIPCNGPIRLNTETDIVGLAFISDPQLGKIETPHGQVKFLQMVGLTQKETERLKVKPTLSEVEKMLNFMKQSNPLLLMDLNRV